MSEHQEQALLSAGRTLVADLPPVAKPRMTRRDQWRERPSVVRYRRFCDALRAFAARQRFTMPESGADIRFYMPMPASWSRARRAQMDGQPHQSRPDLDNLVKAVVDALLPGEDAQVWQLAARKEWAQHGRIEIRPYITGTYE